MKKKFVIFGTGIYYQRYKDLIYNGDIVAFLDNDKKKIGKLLDGKRIVPVEELACLQCQYDYIVIAMKKYQAARNQLLCMGIDDSIILDKDHRGEFQSNYIIREYNRNLWYSSKKRKITLFTHDLGLTGAPLMLMNVVYILKELGWLVQVIAMNDGVLRKDLVERGIVVIVIHDPVFRLDKVEEFYCDSDVIMFNTILFYECVCYMKNQDKKVIWWIHEEEDCYLEMGLKKNVGRVPDNVKIYGVGNRVIRVFREYFPNNKIYNLLYGIQDNEVRKKKKNKITFAMIGTMDYRKGVDVMIEAIKIFCQYHPKQADFLLVGDMSDRYLGEVAFYDEVKCLGKILHEDVLELYNCIDVLVCPSRNDPMPVVVTEAMMMNVAVIVSNNTGQANYIDSYKNGFVFESGDYSQLYELFEWCLINVEFLPQIAARGEKLYRDYFQMRTFKSNLERIFDN